jgi:hypothetical protein
MICALGAFVAHVIFFFWVLSGTFVPHSTQKQEILEGLRPSKLPAELCRTPAGGSAGQFACGSKILLLL